MTSPDKGTEAINQQQVTVSNISKPEEPHNRSRAQPALENTNTKEQDRFNDLFSRPVNKKADIQET